MLLEQVVFNLLDNADKYAPGRHAHASVAVAAGGTRARRSRTRGRDPGRRTCERVFEKFTRLDKGDGRPAGTGLGLAIAKSVVEAMGGTVHAESPARKAAAPAS